MKRLITIFIVLNAFTTFSFGQKVLKTNFGHSGAIQSVAFSTDGKYIASAAGKIKLWDIKTGKELSTFYDKKNCIESVLFHPDGKHMVFAGCSGNLLVYNILTGEEVRVVKVSNTTIRSLVLSPDGNTIYAGGYDKKITAVDFNTGKEKYKLEGYKEGIKCMTVSPDGSFLVSGGYQELVLWDLSSRQKRTTVFDYKGSVNSVQYSKDGKYFYVTGGSKTVDVYKGELGTKEYTLSSHSEGTRAIAISPDGNIAYVSDYDKIIMKVDLINKRVLKKLGSISDENILSMAYSPDGKTLAMVGVEKKVILLDTETDEIITKFEGVVSGIWDLDCSPSGSNVACSYYFEDFRIWDLASVSQIYTPQQEKKISTFNTELEFSPDGKDLVTSSFQYQTGDPVYKLSATLESWDVASGNRLVKFEKHNIRRGTPRDVHYSPDGRFVATSHNDGKFSLFDSKTGKLVKTISPYDKDVVKFVFSPDGKYIISQESYKTLKCWGLETQNPIWSIAATAEIRSMSLCPQSNSFIASWGSNIHLIDMKTGGVIKKFNFNDALIISVLILPDGKRFLSGGVDKCIRLWDIETGKVLKTLKVSGVVGELVCSDDGKKVFASYGGILDLWDIENGDKLVSMVGIKNTNEWAIFTPDGYWDGSMNCGNYFFMAKNLDLYNIDQFAVKNNRPDIILERLQSPNKELISHFKRQFKKRLRKLGISEEDVSKESHTPESKIIASKKVGKFVELSLKFNDSKYALKHYNIFVNDVPIYGRGKTLSGSSQKITEKVELITGKNKIEVSCMNKKGVESYRDDVTFSYDETTNGDLYVLTIGVSKYKNPKLNLAYAHKDALDLEQVCKDLKGKGFENVYTKTLTNEQVTTANIKAAKDFVKNAKVDDTFILFIAGHGMHDTDEEATYYYLTHNTDLKNLKGTAATFETIEDLLQGIPPRNKLFLMDACESGELDPEDEMQYLASATQAGVNSRGFKKTGTVNAIRQSAEKQSVQNRTYLLNRNRYIYNDLVRRSGAIVFSSSKGGELSYERSDIENGLFTEYIIKALTTKEADENKDGIVSTDELRKYVSAKVAEASKGLQHPTVDRDNIYQKFGFKL